MKIKIKMKSDQILLVTYYKEKTLAIMKIAIILPNISSKKIHIILIDNIR